MSKITISHKQNTITVPPSSSRSHNKLLDFVRESFPNIRKPYITLYFDGIFIDVNGDNDFIDVLNRSLQTQNQEVNFWVFDIGTVMKQSNINTEVDVNDLEILSDIQSRLSQFTTAVEDLSKNKQEQIRRTKLASEYENRISELEAEIKVLTTELSIQKHKNDELIDRNLKQDEELYSIKKEKEDMEKLKQSNIDVLKEALKQKNEVIGTVEKSNVTLQETLTKMGKEILNKGLEIIELKKEKDSKLLFESQVNILKEEVQKKTKEYVDLTNEVLQYKAEKETFYKKATNLESELEKQREEKEILQNSMIQLQQNHLPNSLIMSHPPVMDNLTSPLSYPFSPQIYPKFPSPNTNSISNQIYTNIFPPPFDKPEEKPLVYESPEYEKYSIELDILESLGHNDRARNLELMMKYNDTNEVIYILARETPEKPLIDTTEPIKDLPEDILMTDILMLKNMGFTNLQQNIELLRNNGYNVSIVVDFLLNSFQV